MGFYFGQADRSRVVLIAGLQLFSALSTLGCIFNVYSGDSLGFLEWKLDKIVLVSVINLFMSVLLAVGVYKNQRTYIWIWRQWEILCLLSFIAYIIFFAVQTFDPDFTFIFIEESVSFLLHSIFIVGVNFYCNKVYTEFEEESLDLDNSYPEKTFIMNSTETQCKT